MNRKIIAGNWKMNLDIAQAQALATGISDELKSRTIPSNLSVVLAPSHPYLLPVKACIAAENEAILQLSAQDCSWQQTGAFTGDVSAKMLKDIGCGYTLLGHSERRKYQAETDDILLQKTKRAFENDLKVIFCCGETLEQRNAGNYFDVIEKQLKTVFYELKTLENFVVAYEPVWAIGTGVTASPQQAQEVHAFIRKLFSFQFGEQQAQQLCILYGGSCNSSNAAELFSQKDIDGGLIGGAALDKQSFLAIIDAMIQHLS